MDLVTLCPHVPSELGGAGPPAGTGQLHQVHPVRAQNQVWPGWACALAGTHAELAPPSPSNAEARELQRPESCPALAYVDLSDKKVSVQHRKREKTKMQKKNRFICKNELVLRTETQGGAGLQAGALELCLAFFHLTSVLGQTQLFSSSKLQMEDVMDVLPFLLAERDSVEKFGDHW